MNNKFYGQFDPPLDKYLYETFFKNKMFGCSIEAGASNGVTENNTKFFEETLKWKTINVEPLPEWYNELINNRPNSVNINNALHPYSNSEQINFFIPFLPTYGLKNHLGSINYDNLTKYRTKIKKITVNTITYNKIIEDNNITDLDLFVLDIEGYEVEFLKSFNEWKIYPKILVIEIGHLNDDSIIYNIIKHKYTFYDRQFVNNIYILSNSYSDTKSSQLV
jgi:FkbM family methyltransferase